MDEDPAESLRLVRQNSPEANYLRVSVQEEEHLLALFTAALRDNTHVEIVDVTIFIPSNRDLGEDGANSFALWKLFCIALGRLSSLRDLNVTRVYAEEDHAEEFDERLEDAFAKRLAYLLRKTTQIKELNIDSNWSAYFETDLVTQWNTPRIASIAKEIMGHPSLEDFSFFDFTVDQPATMDAFAAAVCTVPNLREFCLSNDSDEPADLCFNAFFLRKLIQLPTLRDLEFEGLLLRESQIDALGLDSSGVEKLSLHQCHLLTVGRVINFFLPGSNLKQLQLSRTKLNHDHCVALSEGLRQTTTLDSISLNNCFEPSTVEHASILASAIGNSNSLRTFSFMMRGINSPPVFWRNLANGLKSNNSLNTLDLSVECFEEDGVGDFASVIRDHTSLTVFDLSHSEFSAAAMAPILCSLSGNATIKEINLRECLGSENVDDLLLLLRENTTCTKLSLQFCQFSDNDYSSILSALKETDVLEELRLVSPWEVSDVSDRTKVAFLAGLSCQGRLKTLNIGTLSNKSQESGDLDEELVETYRKNYTLEECSLEPMGDKHRSEVEALLSLNKVGRQYLIKNNPSRVKGVAVLEAVKDNLDCLFVHLKENPSLCEVRESQSPARADRKRKRGG